MLVVGIGGTLRAGSSSEVALRVALEAPLQMGIEVRCFTAEDLAFPMYDPSAKLTSPKIDLFLDSLRRADGVIVSSPGYHGTISGVLKNAIDYVEELAREGTPYLDGRAFGGIAVAYGWQAAGSTLHTLRTISHALRAWPTPYGAAVNVRESRLVSEVDIDANVRAALHLVGTQVGDWVLKRTPGAAAT